MVLASNEWLRNSGDVKKTQSNNVTSTVAAAAAATTTATTIITTTTPALNADRAAATATTITAIATNNINEEKLLKDNLNSMTTINKESCDIEIEVKSPSTISNDDKEKLKFGEKSTQQLNDNANTENKEIAPQGFEEEQQQHQQEQQRKSLNNIVLKTMDSNNSSTTTDDYTTNNDVAAVEAVYLSELETSRTAVPNINDEQTINNTAATTTTTTGIAELENNNRTYASFINEIIVNSGLETTDATSATTTATEATADSNTNTLNADFITRNSPAATLTSTDLNGQNTLCKNERDREREREREPGFLSSLTIANANTAQTIAMNNANALSLSRLVEFAEQSTAAAAAAAGRSATSILNNSSTGGSSSSNSSSGNNSVRNKNSNSNNAGGINLQQQLQSQSQSQQQTNTGNNCNNGDAKIVLICEKTSHPFETRTISLTPNIECKVGRLIAKCKPSEANAIFDCKVLSRNHAVLWFGSDGKFWVKDTNSSNGTFINDRKLDKDAAELHYGDIVKFGVDVLENSRKEVHGCIIACVKLYFPDGREAISIDSGSPRSLFSGDSCISFDELHRLNVYMQETSQREKALKSKLYNIQNILDATRKNSSSCWSAMISEDQLLHRIHSLEKKLQILEKNMPENALKNEIMKLIDDKSAYQHSAKEALRKVYVERCEAMQKLAKLESEFAASESECKILREQITATEESFQDANERLRLIETEYNNYRTETASQHLEAKTDLEQQIEELNQKIQEREVECLTLRSKISDLIEKRTQKRSSESLGGVGGILDDEKLQKQAIENLDAVIANMDIGDDDDDDDDEDDDEEDAVDEDVAAAVREKQKQKEKTGDVYDFNNSSDSSGNEKQSKSKSNIKKINNKTSKPTGDGEATILKWLQNSDLNKKEGSLDIFKAICSNNESDSSDEHDAISPGANITNEDIEQRCTKLSTKLQSLNENLNQLENRIELETFKIKTERKTEYDEYNDVNDDDDDDGGNTIEKSNGDQTKKEQQQQKEDQSIELLKTTVNLIREAYTEMFDSFKQLNAAATDLKLKSTNVEALQTAMHVARFQKVKNTLLGTLAPVKPATTTASTSTGTGIVGTSTLSEINEVDNEQDDSEDDDDDDDDFDNDQQSIAKSEVSTIVMKNMQEQLQKEQQQEIVAYQIKIDELKIKLNEQEQNSQQTMELLQIECDNYKEKINELTILNEMMLRERERQHIDATAAAAVNATTTTTTSTVSNSSSNGNVTSDMLDTNNGDAVSSDSGVSSIDRTIDTPREQDVQVQTCAIIAAQAEADAAATIANFERQMREDLAAIHNTVTQREEELIAYKESLEKTEKENLLLRDKILEIQQSMDGPNKAALMRYIVPMGIAAFGIMAYLLMTYL